MTSQWNVQDCFWNVCKEGGVHIYGMFTNIMFTQCKVQWKRQMTDHQKASVYHVATACIRKSFCYVRESEHQKYSFQIFGNNICSSMTNTYRSIVNQNDQRDGSFSFFFTNEITKQCYACCFMYRDNFVPHGICFSASGWKCQKVWLLSWLLFRFPLKC